MSQVFDISRPLRTQLAGWPGDTPLNFRLVWRQSDGASVNLGRLITSVHAGTHADAPFHFGGAVTADALPLGAFLGPACVLDVSHAAAAGIITLADLAPVLPLLPGAPRLLLHTGAWPNDEAFPAAVPVLDAPEAVPVLRARGVVLVGVDVPSVDALNSRVLPVHHALAGAGIQILEGLDLSRVPLGPGGVAEYELIALPLNIVGADGAPVRAVLRQFG